MNKVDKVFLVTNRSASRVFYAVPELGIKSRQFEPGETKRISYAELEGLGFMPGGMELIRDYLLIKDEEARDELVGNVEPEYNMTEKEVRELILTGSMDEWLDALDFAPEGVIDLIKNLSVAIPLSDTNKMKAFQDKKGVNLERMIRARQEELAEAEQGNQAAVEKKTAEKAVAAVPAGRRTTGSKYQTQTQVVGSKYKVVSKKEEPTE